MALASILGGLGLGGMASGQSGYSDSSSLGLGGSSGSSWGLSQGDAESKQYSDAWSSGYGVSQSESNAENWSEGMSENSSWGSSQNSSYGAVYGSEASAKDVERALEANLVQDYFNKQQMAYNSSEAEKARAWEAMMSNSSYQRAVKDLRAAGLNPILAAMNMGASTPSGAVASSGLGTANKATTFADQRSNSQGSSNSGSYGYSKNKGYGYSKSKSSSYSENKSQSTGRGWSKSHNEAGSGSENKSWNMETGKSHSENSNNLKNFLGGLGDMFNGLTSAIKGF